MVIIGWLGICPAGAGAQGLTGAASLIFYGDNTEFHNPFREGETIFGAAVRAEARAALNEKVTVAAGVFANQRFGSDSAFELVRPVLALRVHGRRSTFTFGTLDTPRAGDPPGPDRTGPHGLLPPLQRETLAFDRPYEAGLQWTFAGKRLDHDLWLQWQRLNTAEHRERLDAGARLEWRLRGPFSVPVQTHVVHEGGQLFASGVVRDSLALASGLVVSTRKRLPPGDRTAGSINAAQLAVTFEVLGLWSHDVPNRQQPDRTRDGAGFFGRAAVEKLAWRAHFLAWRGDDYIKDEGDPNYLSRRRDGTLYRGVRDYSEVGLARTFALAPGAHLAVAFRYHRIERFYEYSYRLLAVVDVSAKLK